MKKENRQRGDYIDLTHDGRVVLFKRQNLKSPKWQVRIRVPNATGYRIQSTRTADRREAERFALDLYEELYIRVKRGGSIASPKIRTIIDEWINATRSIGYGTRGGDIEQSISTIKNYFYRYVQDARVSELDQLLLNYLSWRSTNYINKKPSTSTLRREQNALRSFLNYAQQNGHIEKYTLPKPPSESRRTNRRPTFTLDEWQTIYKSAKNWIQEGAKTGHKDSRILAYRYFMILANSGIRVGEARMLKWSDLQFFQTDDSIQVIASVSGKTGTRDVIFQPNSETHFQHLWRLYQKWVNEARIEQRNPPDIKYVFQDKTGKPIGSFKKSFRSLLQFANIEPTKGNANRTIYSLRHFYATMRLSNNVSPFILAKQMGTSVEILENYYGQIVTKDLAKRITNTSEKKIKYDKILTL